MSHELRCRIVIYLCRRFSNARIVTYAVLKDMIKQPCCDLSDVVTYHEMKATVRSLFDIDVRITVNDGLFDVAEVAGGNG